MTTSVRYVLNVEGVTWDGGRSINDYELRGHESTHPKTLTAVKTFAGDFQKVTAASIRKTVTHTEITTEVLK